MGSQKDFLVVLQLDEGELSLDVLTELHELTLARDTGELSTSFINARQEAECHITPGSSVAQAKALCSPRSHHNYIAGQRCWE